METYFSNFFSSNFCHHFETASALKLCIPGLVFFGRISMKNNFVKAEEFQVSNSITL